MKLILIIIYLITNVRGLAIDNKYHKYLEESKAKIIPLKELNESGKLNCKTKKKSIFKLNIS
jgi:hypothetical protein